MNSSGNIGIGKDPSTYRLDLNGITRIYSGTSVSSLLINPTGGYYGPSIEPTGHNACNLGQANHGFRYVYCQELLYTSDKRLKENIRPVNNALDLVLKLNAVKYDLKKEATTDSKYGKTTTDIENIENSRKNIYGFIAQEVNELIPEIVNYDDSTDIYAIDYIRLIPILAQAIKEQNVVIEQLKSTLNQKLKSTFEGELPLTSYGTSSLSQNQPNPFNERTIIEFTISNDTKSAILYIYDLQGKQIKSIVLVERGNGSVTVTASELQAGMYYYSLITDGVLVATEKMILTE